MRRPRAPPHCHDRAVSELDIDRGNDLVIGEPERLWTGAVWSEGPVWLPALEAVRWSDIPNDRILQWDRRTGETSVYLHPAEYTNGRTLDLAGQVVQCSHGRRRVE